MQNKNHKMKSEDNITAISILIYLALILIPTFFLYFPYLSNELVFDDNNIFNGQHSIYDLAIEPFSRSPRTFPLFTLGFVETIWHSTEANRLASLLLHSANALLLFRVIFDLIHLCETRISTQSALIAASGGALIFALHPVAIYGAAYLAQRTTLFALFFSLWSIFFYLRSCRRDSLVDIYYAALFYTLAIFAKEHAIMLPASVVLISALNNTSSRTDNLKKAAHYILASSIPSIYILLYLKGVIGAYEPAGIASTQSLPEFSMKSSHYGQWAMSATNQVIQFFHYVFLWTLPNADAMSIDIRIDFAHELQSLNIALHVCAFLFWIAFGIALLRIGGLPGLAGFGLLFTAILFFTEFTTFRLQEPFVLYRSYLWAPGIILSFVAIFAKVRPRLAITLIAAFAAALIPLSRDRLESLRNGVTVWHDAAIKLKSNDLPGADRIFFNLGNELFKIGSYQDAQTNMSRVIALNPSSPNGYLGRAAIHARLGQFQAALTDYEQAFKRSEEEKLKGQIEYDIASLLHRQGKVSEARTMLNSSAKRGNLAASITLQLEAK